MGRQYVQIINDQTKILYDNIQITLDSVSSLQLKSEFSGMPLWKHFYHMLHSFDQWYIDPFSYKEPEFHEIGMNSLYKSTYKELTKDELINYYKSIKEKVNKYLENLSDEELCQKPKECKFDSLTLILAQNRHLMYHVGAIHGYLDCIFGIWPEYKGILTFSRKFEPYHKLVQMI